MELVLPVGLVTYTHIHFVGGVYPSEAIPMWYQNYLQTMKKYGLRKSNGSVVVNKRQALEALEEYRGVER